MIRYRSPSAPPRPHRPLDLGTPEVHDFPTADGVRLRLTRYRGGRRGPVLLAHGLGVSSRIFTTDTIEPNLTEYLHAHGFDVWLLDFRASIELPSASSQFTGDEIATLDYPAAVSVVRELTGSPTIQIVAHCYGSTTFVMAMLAGLHGVRAAVCSQVATHLLTPPLMHVKSGLHTPELLEALGVSSLTAYVDDRADWLERLFDLALGLWPASRDQACDSPVCHRITFMYGPLYQHEQLSPVTHDALHEMFGVANLHALDHLTRMIRNGHVCAADGTDAYLPHLDRLAKIPIALIHGSENRCFLPASTEQSYALLRERVGDGRCRRHVIPGYGHIDCIFGRNAATDVYPFIVAHLEAADG
jgi:cholesterol oxidase